MILFAQVSKQIKTVHSFILALRGTDSQVVAAPAPVALSQPFCIPPIHCSVSLQFIRLLTYPSSFLFCSDGTVVYIQ